MSDNELIRRGDAKLVVEHQDEGWHDGISGDYHPYTKAEFAKQIAQAIAALPAIPPATSPGVTAGADGAPMWCDACRAVGAYHCAHPDECGYMLSATAAADNWKAWIDDLPLPEDFDLGVGRLQDFITALVVRIDILQPSTTPPTALDDPKVRKLVAGAADAVREVYSDHAIARQAADYMEQLLYAALAAMRAGRRFIGVEKDPRWFEAAVARVKAEAAGGQMDFALGGVA